MRDNKVKYAAVGADTAVSNAAGVVLYGIVCISNGTMAGVYDNASAASGQLLIPSQALTAGQQYLFGALGVTCNNGIFCDWTSGSFLVLYQDA